MSVFSNKLTRKILSRKPRRTFVVGDLQGCLDPLLDLLDQVKFNPKQDELWCVGDLVNRGPDSLGTLQFLYKIRKSIKVVLGNHDLHFLAVAYGEKSVKKGSDLLKIHDAKNGKKILKWLRKQPLMHWDKERKLAMCHAGIPPMWSLKKAKELSKEVESVLKSKKHKKMYAKMYGNTPELWDDELTGFSRLRVIINYFTRMRFLGPNGELELENKQGADESADDLTPWFEFENKLKKNQVFFGHWAALEGLFDHPQVVGLDTGCVWGGPMTLLEIETGKRYQAWL